METSLYGPLKRYFNNKGFIVKGEVSNVDLVALPNAFNKKSEPIIVELKTGFSLSLFHQAIQRQSITKNVYIAVPRKKGKKAYVSLRRNKMLSRRLGIGLITVCLDQDIVKVICEPGVFKRKIITSRKVKLIEEFEALHGDPNKGGMMSSGVMTAYKQAALRCAKILSVNGPTKASLVANKASYPMARNLMAANYYGWFVKTGRGVYGISERGEDAILEYVDLINTMFQSQSHCGD